MIAGACSTEKVVLMFQHGIQRKRVSVLEGDYMAKCKDIWGNIRECEDKTITISLERYNTLIIKEAIADYLVEVKKKEEEDN